MHGRARQPAQKGDRRKKLIEAGRAWAYIKPGKDGTAEDLQYIKLPAAPPVNDQPDTCYIDHVNREAWDVFLGCCAQWVCQPMGGPMCLDRGAIQSVLSIYAVKNIRETFDKILLIENGALAQMADNAAFQKLKTQNIP